VCGPPSHGVGPLIVKGEPPRRSCGNYGGILKNGVPRAIPREKFPKERFKPGPMPLKGGLTAQGGATGKGATRKPRRENSFKKGAAIPRPGI